MMAVLAWQTEIRGLCTGSWCLRSRLRRLGGVVPPEPAERLQAREVLRGRRVLRARVVRPRVVRCWHAGEFEDGGQPAARGLGQLGRAAVRGDQAVHDGQAESGAVGIGGGEAQEGALPVFGLMPGPSSATEIRAPAVIAVVVTVTCPPALSASSALAMRL